MTAPSTQPPDNLARERILTDLSTNMLVEAGAGSGKTTSLIGRMHALVVRGTPVENIAAVTFTRKAAQELRERFQLKLEDELRTGDPSTDAWRRCDQALRGLDRAFLGTIHSFCSRILREYPLDVALDPSFTELTEDDWEQLVRQFWARWLERCNLIGDSALTDLATLGVDPQSLYDGFKVVMTYQDVDFPLVESAAPNGDQCRRKLEALLTRASGMMPPEEPAKGWDSLMRMVNTLRYHQGTSDWSKIAEFCAALEVVTKSGCDTTLNRWGDVKLTREGTKALQADFLSLLENEIASLLQCWREHRYPAVMRTLKRAAAEFGRHRHDTGQLGFEDLLLLSAKLLRQRSAVRDALGARYRHLLIDEFQDTDPIQAEVCFLLASDSSEGNDWRAVTPREGALFVVGDPKQSIYRFRRADISVYEFAKRRMHACGAVLALTANFRSVPPIADFVNEYFAEVFPADGSDVQAQFSPMQTDVAFHAGDGVGQYWVRPEARNASSIINADAASVASWIEDRIKAGEAKAADFLILTPRREPIAAYARELGMRNIAVSTSGAKLPQELELTEVIVVLRALADPDNPVCIAAALEGMFFGCSPADLYDAHVGGADFSITHPPSQNTSQVDRALAQLHEWWILSQRQAADVVVEHILEDTGILCYAASQILGDSRAGALLRLVDVLCAASMAGPSGLADAIERIERLLTEDSDDTPLRPGRTDAVRVMNLHKAKGLEATIVILATPTSTSQHPPSVHVVRSDDGPASGGVLITAGNSIIAQPVGWSDLAEEEQRFAGAEAQRLLYVATTRARKELIVARCELPPTKTASEPRVDTSFWAPLGDSLSERAAEFDIVPAMAPARRVTDRTPQQVANAITGARQSVMLASVASTSRRTVTESTREEREMARAYDFPVDGNSGIAWGRAVHRCIEAAGCGRDGTSLTTFIAAVVADEGLRADKCAEISVLLAELRESEVWAGLMAGNAACFELPVLGVTHDGDGTVVSEGVIDAASLGDDGWFIADWKTDGVDQDTWNNRAEHYQRQVGAYEQMLTALSGRVARSVLHRVR